MLRGFAEVITFPSVMCVCVCVLQGEYPLATASAVERSEAGKNLATGVAPARGKDVVMTFSMQGAGNGCANIDHGCVDGHL